MGYRHSREEIVDAAAAVALSAGVGALTYSRVAAHLGISDRMVVYYLPTKADLVAAAADGLSGHLLEVLGSAFGTARRPADDLLRAAWPVLASEEADRIFAVFLEVVGLAAAGTKPFDDLASALLHGWADWLAERTEGRTAEVRRREALGVIARLDGLLLMRHTAGPEAADAAARALGLRSRH